MDQAREDLVTKPVLSYAPKVLCTQLHLLQKTGGRVFVADDDTGLLRVEVARALRAVFLLICRVV